MAVSSSIIALLVLIAGVASKYTVPANVAEQFLNTALEAQGTSQGRLIEVLSSGNGEPQAIAQGFNSEIKATILEPNGDVFRVNLGGLKQLLGNTAELSLTKLHQNPSLSSSLRPKIDQLLEARSGDLEAWIERSPIPVELFTEARRRKRDTALEIAPRDLLGDLVGTIGGALEPVVDGVVNGVVDTVNTVVGGTVNAVTGPIVSSIGGIVGGVLQPITSLLSSLISTLGSALAPITSFLSSTLGFILEPLNQAIKTVVGTVLNQLQCGLGEALLSPVIGLVNQLIDTLIPCGTSCTSL